MYVGVLPAGLSAVHIRSACRGQERVYPCLGLELTDGCEPLVGGWDSNPDREVPVRTGLIEICRGTEEAHDCLRAMARLACGVGGSRREGEPGPNEVTCWAGQGESTGRQEGRFALARSLGAWGGVHSLLQCLPAVSAPQTVASLFPFCLKVCPEVCVHSSERHQVPGLGF